MEADHIRAVHLITSHSGVGSDGGMGPDWKLSENFYTTMYTVSNIFYFEDRLHTTIVFLIIASAVLIVHHCRKSFAEAMKWFWRRRTSKKEEVSSKIFTSNCFVCNLCLTALTAQSHKLTSRNGSAPLESY